ncbi:unnamed protein product [Euphydryas editha]|uniref:Uncharacterized protein n=1 Tax=Euphydryas editha TaxID=104508 RepID=A0AAU9TYT6_EUPED|nr:unnamed protein product [Euphydryas editha]
MGKLHQRHYNWYLTVLRVTGVAPLTLLTRRQHCVPPELLRLVNIVEESVDFDLLEQQVHQKMAAAAEYAKQRFDKNKAKIQSFQRSDYVLDKNNPRNQTCLDLKYSEPYEIQPVVENDRASVDHDLKIKKKPRHLLPYSISIFLPISLRATVDHGVRDCPLPQQHSLDLIQN